MTSIKELLILLVISSSFSLHATSNKNASPKLKDLDDKTFHDLFNLHWKSYYKAYIKDDFWKERNDDHVNFIKSSFKKNRFLKNLLFNKNNTSIPFDSIEVFQEKVLRDRMLIKQFSNNKKIANLIIQYLPLYNLEFTSDQINFKILQKLPVEKIAMFNFHSIIISAMKRTREKTLKFLQNKTLRIIYAKTKVIDEHNKTYFYLWHSITKQKLKGMINSYQSSFMRNFIRTNMLSVSIEIKPFCEKSLTVYQEVAKRVRAKDFKGVYKYTMPCYATLNLAWIRDTLSSSMKHKIAPLYFFMYLLFGTKWKRIKKDDPLFRKPLDELALKIENKKYIYIAYKIAYFPQLYKLSLDS